MALDPRIPLMGQQFQLEPQSNALARVLAVRSAQQQQALAAAQMQDLIEQRRLAVESARQKMAQEQAQRQALASLPSPQMVAGQRAMAGGGGPTNAAAQRVQPIDPQAMAIYQAVINGLLPISEWTKTLDQNFGRPEVGSWQERAGPNNRPEKVGVSKYGDVIGAPLPQPVKYERVDRGGQIDAVDPYQQFAPMPKTMTPEGRDASARGWAAERRQAAEQALPQWDAATGSFVDRKTRTVTAAANAPGKPMPEAATKQVTGARNLRDAIDEYQTVLAGWSNMDMLKPDRRAAMGQAYNNMMLQAKEAYNLGVLNGPDYSILQSVVKDPTKWDSALVSNDALRAQSEALRDTATKIEANVLKAHGKPAAPTTGNAPLTVDTKSGVPAVKFLGWEK